MVRQDNPRGLITEVPAGRFDVALGVKALMVKEAWEEVGLRLSESDIILINEGVPLACSPGVLTERIYLAYAYGRASELQPREEVHFTAEGEEIRQVRVSADNLSLRALACEDLKTFALIQWFLAYQT
jgi:8-oxo-dGTP pyrophosphatase MutT (NUDIX family)